VTQGADVRQFEQFQGRAVKLALWLWMAALVIGLAVSQGFSPIVGGIFLGGAASVGAFRYKVWTLRRLASRADRKTASRLPLLDAGRYVILAAALVAAVVLARRDGDSRWVFAAAAALFLCNLAVIVLAVYESRKRG
jgi:hypothetical protein